MKDTKEAAASSSFWWRMGCLSAGLAVTMGAFGAHGLKNVVTEQRMLDVWSTASHYHLIHSVALVIASKPWLHMQSQPPQDDSAAAVSSCKGESLEADTHPSSLRLRNQSSSSSSSTTSSSSSSSSSSLSSSSPPAAATSSSGHLSATLFAAGIGIFSGSLYALVLTNIKILGAITPIGGLALIGGWLALSCGH